MRTLAGFVAAVMLILIGLLVLDDVMPVVFGSTLGILFNVGLDARDAFKKKSTISQD